MSKYIYQFAWSFAKMEEALFSLDFILVISCMHRPTIYVVRDFHLSHPDSTHSASQQIPTRISRAHHKLEKCVLATAT